MTIEMFLAFLFIALLIIELIWIYVIKRSASYYRSIISQERVRDHFAYLRQELITLVKEDKLDINSDTFKMFYNIQTFILRRPDKYRGISEVLSDSLLLATSKHTSSGLDDEIEAWNSGTKNMAMNTAKGLAIVIEEFAPFRKMVAKIKALYIIRLVDLYLDFRNPEVKTIKIAEKRLMQDHLL